MSRTGWSQEPAELLLEPRAVLLVTAILQPCSVDEVVGFMRSLVDLQTPQAGRIDLPAWGDLRRAIEGLAAEEGGQGWILPIEGSDQTQRYALTQAGEAALAGADDQPATSLRRLRDTARFYLLRGPRGFEGEAAEDAFQLPGQTDRFAALFRRVDAVARTTSALSAAPWSEASHWSSSIIFVAGDGSAGLLRLPRAQLPRYLSFNSFDQIRRARPEGGRALAPEDLALCLGISLKRLAWMADRRRTGQYRCFRLRKKSGGERIIEAPFVPLKVFQRFVLDFILRRPRLEDDGSAALFEDPPLDPSLHSFRLGRTTVTNAKPHLRQGFVAGVDIEDFFGSIDEITVRETLSALPESFTGLKLSEESLRLIARLCTTEIPPAHCGGKGRTARHTRQRSRLPQGGPASPMLSNLVLIELDRKMARVAAYWGHVYTRYADDITISGPDRNTIAGLIGLLSAELHGRYGLRLNLRKTRYHDKNSQQLVTGVVVNEKLQPPSASRRRIRAAFDSAGKDRRVDRERFNRLNGYVGYLLQFAGENAELGQTVAGYQSVLAALRVE